jgi:hypothetical protein
MRLLEKSLRAYKAVALIAFTTIVLFVAANLAAWALRPLCKRTLDDPVSKVYGWEEMRKIYPDLDGDQMMRLLAETWSRPFVYESYTHFREVPFKGAFINVDTNGFRRSRNQGPWPPDPHRYNVFLFGGSTAFGYGVPDHQTIASFLQGALAQSLQTDVRVYNFARGSYHCAQERILFEQLLLAGFVPRLALWIDGLNEFYFADGLPQFSDVFDQVLNGEWVQRHRFDLLRRLPLLALIEDCRRATPDVRASRAGLEADHTAEEIRGLADAVCQRYLKNKQLTQRIAAAAGVEACFVWQPVPTYRYDLKHHLFQGPNLRHHWLSRHGYARMAEILKSQTADTNLLWCADLQEGLSEALYLDSIHYTARMSELLARQIADQLVQRRLVR